VSLIKRIGRLIRWRPARKGETGYAQRQYVLKHPKNAAETAERVSRRTVLKKKGGGKTLETLAKERRETYSPETQAKFSMAAFKRRGSYEKKKIYKDESAKDISWFERFKAKRLERHISETTGKEVGGAHTAEEYKRGKAFAERHAEVEKDFLKYVSSPVKKRSQGRRRGGTPRTEREARRIAVRAQPRKRVA
jgi:hypothetical protein